MKHILMMTTLAVAGSLGAAAAVQEGAVPREGPTTTAAPAPTGLTDLAGLTRSCSMAALNAAARRAASVPSQGKYQFSYFNLISDSHHARYEVHFTSNYEGELPLKYCVEIYCQQGWDPKDVKAKITEVGNPPQRGRAAARHQTGCDAAHTPAKGRRK